MPLARGEQCLSNGNENGDPDSDPDSDPNLVSESDRLHRVADPNADPNAYSYAEAHT